MAKEAKSWDVQTTPKPPLNSAAGMAGYGRALRMRDQPFKIPVLEDLKEWKGKRAMVFAPHQDDDVLGCGGTIRRLRDIGAGVRVIYVTDGSRGSVRKRRGLASIRAREAVDALEVLACTDYAFLGFDDGHLELSEESVGAVGKEISSYRPHAVFATSPYDGPSDHMMTAAIVGKALAGCQDEVVCYNYEIWNPVMPNRLVDISEVMGLKERAMRKHASQMEVVNYTHHFHGLNAYRAIYTSNCEYCEAFLRLDKGQQVQLCEEAMRNPLTVDGG